MSDGLFYITKQGGEAEQIIKDYFTARELDARKLKRWIEQFDFLDHGTGCLVTDSRATDFKIKRGAKLPDEWCMLRSRFYSNYAHPRGTKAGNALSQPLKNIEMVDIKGFTARLFGDTGLFFEGMRIIRGVGHAEYSRRHIIQFQSADHVKHFKDHGKWPKGLRPIKASSVQRMKEKNDADV